MNMSGVGVFLMIALSAYCVSCQGDVLIGCGGFVKSDVEIDYTQVKV